MKMGVDSLRTNLSSPGRAYLWDVIIPNVIGAGSDTETLMLRCQSTNLPGRSVGEILVPYKQTAGTKYHGRAAYDHKWSCTFVEGEDKAIFNAIYQWFQQLVHDREGTGVEDPDAKADILLSLVNTKGVEYSKIRLIGCYPENVENVPLSYENDEVIKFNCTFSYDSWENVA